MIKIRLEYADNQKGIEELQKTLDVLEKNFTILSKSKAYQNRNSLYKRIYLDLDIEEKE